ncbi:hypothetical protein GQ457_16G019250 [Hibiscus cannabinus]
MKPLKWGGGAFFGNQGKPENVMFLFLINEKGQRFLLEFFQNYFHFSSSSSSHLPSPSSTLIDPPSFIEHPLNRHHSSLSCYHRPPPLPFPCFPDQPSITAKTNKTHSSNTLHHPKPHP